MSGAYRGFFVIDTLEHASIIGVHFRPGGAYPFVGMPADELADAHVDLETLWARPAVELRERLCAAATPTQRFRLLEEALAARLSRALVPRGVVRVALEQLGRHEAGVREIADHVNLSHRRFIDVFRREVGMMPKLFSRVRRFQRVVAVAQRTSAPDWARLALECGYCDQSHLIRDFLAFSGLSPAAYLRQRSERVKEHHVALPAS